MKINKKTYIIVTIAIFGVLYSLISLVNHYLFRTYALDLGLYTNALFKYGHFRMGDDLMIKTTYESILGGHFDLYLVLFSPLVYVFGTYTLLILQIVSILFGGIGIYKYFRLRDNNNELMAYFAMIYFFLFFGIFSALSYDYHSVVVSAGLIPWFFLVFHRGKYIKSSLLVIMILISQENISLLMVFIFLGLMIEYRKNRIGLLVLSIYSILSLLYFVIVTSILIPSFSSTHAYSGFLYSVLGHTPFEALSNLVLHPFESFKILFINHNNSITGDYVKIEMHILILVSGAFMLFLKPQYILMLIPIYFQKLFHDNYNIWGIDSQYCIEFAPLLAIGIFSVIVELKNVHLKFFLTAVVIIGALGSTVRIMDNTVLFTDKSRIRFYQVSHYSRDYNVRTVYHQLNLIPEEAKICAQSPFVPHLALRNSIYQFPLIKDAEFIIYSEKEEPYPIDKNTFNSITTALENSKEWNVKYKDDNLTILKKSVYNKK